MYFERQDGRGAQAICPVPNRVPISRKIVPFLGLDILTKRMGWTCCRLAKEYQTERPMAQAGCILIVRVVEGGRYQGQLKLECHELKSY